MKSYRWIIAGTIACLLLAAAGYFGANRLNDSIAAYRSPLHNSPPAAQPTPTNGLTRHVVVVLIDGLRLDTAENATVMPTLSKLREQGASAMMHSGTPSFSQTGYSVIFTGATPSISDGPTLNMDIEDIPTWTQDNLFSSLHRAGITTGISGYYWFEKLVPQTAVDLSFYTPGEDRAADVDVMNAALPMLEARDPQFLLIHIDQVDYAGHHEGGGRSAAWNAASSRADTMLAQVVERMDFSRDALLILSDHGHTDHGGHGGNESTVLTEPFVLVGAGVVPGVYPDMRMIDVAPTLAALMGVGIPTSAEGQILTDMLKLTTEQQSAWQAAEKAQKAQLTQAVSTALGQTGSNPAEIIAKRQQRERLPRILLALVLALLPLTVLLNSKNRRRWIIWLLGAFIYVGLTLLRFLVLEGRTFSYSSVISSGELITFNVVTGIISLMIAWLVISIPSKTYAHGGRYAAESALGFTFAAVYLLALVILTHFALDGLWVTWSLPHPVPFFMTLLAMMQWMVVSAAGLLICGGSALVAYLLSMPAVSKKQISRSTR